VPPRLFSAASTRVLLYIYRGELPSPSTFFGAGGDVLRARAPLFFEFTAAHLLSFTSLVQGLVRECADFFLSLSPVRRDASMALFSRPRQVYCGIFFVLGGDACRLVALALRLWSRGYRRFFLGTDPSRRWRDSFFHLGYLRSFLNKSTKLYALIGLSLPSPWNGRCRLISFLAVTNGVMVLFSPIDTVEVAFPSMPKVG